MYREREAAEEALQQAVRAAVAAQAGMDVDEEQVCVRACVCARARVRLWCPPVIAVCAFGYACGSAWSWQADAIQVPSPSLVCLQIRQEEVDRLSKCDVVITNYNVLATEVRYTNCIIV